MAKFCGLRLIPFWGASLRKIIQICKHRSALEVTFISEEFWSICFLSFTIKSPLSIIAYHHSPVFSNIVLFAKHCAKCSNHIISFDTHENSVRDDYHFINPFAYIQNPSYLHWVHQPGPHHLELLTYLSNWSSYFYPWSSSVYLQWPESMFEIRCYRSSDQNVPVVYFSSKETSYCNSKPHSQYHVVS